MSLALLEGPMTFLAVANSDCGGGAAKDFECPPVWFEDCSERLKDTSEAALFQGKTPATFAHWLQTSFLNLPGLNLIVYARLGHRLDS